MIRFMDFKRRSLPGSSRIQQIFGQIFARQEQKLLLAFRNLAQQKSKGVQRDLKISKVLGKSNIKLEENLRAVFWKLRKENMTKKLCKFVKVANSRGAKDAFDKLRFFMAHTRCLDIADAYKVEKLVGVMTRLKEKKIASGLRAISVGPLKSEQMQSAAKSLEKALLKLRGDHPLRRAFATWKRESRGAKNIEIASNLQKIQTTNDTNKSYLKVIAFERLQNQLKIDKLKDDMKNMLKQSQSDYYKNMIIRNMLNRMIQAQRSKTFQSVKKLMHKKDIEIQQDNLVITRCTKSVNLWNDRVKSKLRDALKKLRDFRRSENFRDLKKSAKLKNAVELIRDKGMRPSFEKLRRNKDGQKKLVRFAHVSERKQKDEFARNFQKLKDWSQRKTEARLLAIFLSQLIGRKNSFETSQSFSRLKTYTPVQVDDLSRFASILQDLFKKQLKFGLLQIKIRTGFELSPALVKLKNVVLSAEKKYGQQKSSAFAVLKTQQIVRELSLVYYIGLNKLLGIANKRLKQGYQAILMEERFQMYRDYYNTFWQQKLKDMEADLYNQKIKERKDKMFSDFYINKSVVSFSNALKGPLRYAFFKIKEAAGLGAENLYSYKDINTVVRNTALISGLYGILKKKRLLLLSHAVRRWKENTHEDEHTSQSFNRTGILDSLYKKADFNIHYKRWLYCARLTKILEKCIAKRKIAFFNELLTKPLVVIKKQHYQLDTGSLVYNEQLKRKMAVMHLAKICRTAKQNTFAQICRFASKNQKKETAAKDKNTYYRNESGTRLIRSGARSKSKVDVKRQGRQSKQRVEEEDENESRNQVIYSRNAQEHQADRNRSRSNFSASRQKEIVKAEKRATEVSSNHQYEDSRSVSRVSRVSRVSQAYKESFTSNQQHGDHDFIHRTRSFKSFVQSETQARTSETSKTYARLMNSILLKIMNKRMQQAINTLHENSKAEQLSMNQTNAEKLKASYIDMVLKRGTVKILKNHREAQREALFRIFQNLGE